MLQRALARVGAEVLRRRFRGFLGLHLPEQARPPGGSPEAWFESSDGRRIPVFSEYRYSIKPGWRYFKELQLLDRLRACGRLGSDDAAFLRMAQGHRTLGVPLAAVRERLSRILPSAEDLFIAAPADAELPLLRLTDREIEAGIEATARAHRKLLRSITSLADCRLPSGTRLLEIGFSSGGHSLFAFERLGFRVIGIDNDFGGLHAHPGIAEHIARRIGSRVALRGGDITRRTDVEAGALDVVYSASVLEHLQDLAGAARETYRVLRPGGLALHLYHSFFAASGGHALGTLDSPWAHVRLGLPDTLRYLDALRPFEAGAAKAWCSGALNRATLGDVQRSLLSAGFRLRLIQRIKGDEALSRELTPELAADCLARNPGLSLEDLVSETILVLAEKGL